MQCPSPQLQLSSLYNMPRLHLVATAVWNVAGSDGNWLLSLLICSYIDTFAVIGKGSCIFCQKWTCFKWLLLPNHRNQKCQIHTSHYLPPRKRVFLQLNWHRCFSPNNTEDMWHYIERQTFRTLRLKLGISSLYAGKLGKFILRVTGSRQARITGLHISVEHKPCLVE